MKFSKEQLAKLEARARTLKTAYRVSAEGVKPNIVWGVKHTWGLFKIGFPTTHRARLLEIAQELADKTGSELLFVFADWAVYYRKHPTQSTDALFED